MTSLNTAGVGRLVKTTVAWLTTSSVLAAARAHPHYSAPLGPDQGRGVACGFWFNIGGESSATVHVNEDGSITAATVTCGVQIISRPFSPCRPCAPRL